LSICWAQDTLVLRNGQKISVKVISVNIDVVYFIPPDVKKKSIRYSKVRYIKYGDGAIYTNKDTVKAKPYILISGGKSIPFSGYGRDYYNSDLGEYIYSGYASDGFVLSLLGGLKFNSGWEISAMFSYCQNEFNATGFMNESAAIFMDNYMKINGNFINSVNTTMYGTYYYNNYSCLVGITKDWEKGPICFGLDLMGGELISIEPYLHGIATLPGYNSYYLNVNSDQKESFNLGIGVHLDVKIFHKLFVRGIFDIQYASPAHSANYQFVDMTNGNVVYSGTLSDGGYHSTKLSTGIVNASLGIGYAF
jgi:hypothetical protein